MNDIETGQVILPCSTRDFGDFISGLLGKPQTITNRIRGPFEITLQGVLDVHALLLQRVKQQNDGSLMQFTAKLMFHDGSSVLLNSISDFESYNEVRPLACTALHVSWVFLVKFNDKRHPEKQQIDLSFLGSDNSVLDAADLPTWAVFSDRTGSIVYRIAHTARTWGADVDGLLGAHVTGLIEDIPKVRKFCGNHSGKLALGLFCAVFLCGVATVNINSGRFLETQREKLRQWTSGGASGEVSAEQFKAVVDIVASGAWERFLLTSFLFLLASFVFAVFAGVVTLSLADNLPPSFVLLTKESEKRRKKITQKRNGKWIWFWIMCGVELTIGIVGNVCYSIWFN